MSRRQFDPGNSSITRGDIHANDSFVYDNVNTNNVWQKFISDVVRVLSGPFAIAWLAQKIVQTIKFAMRDHILLSWVMGNLSYQTGHTLAAHRKWIWWIEHNGLPNAWKRGKGYVLYWVGQSEKYTTAWAKYLEGYLKSYAYSLYQDMLRRLYETKVAVEALAQSYYERNRVYIGQVLQAAQNAATAAYNDSVAYSNKIRQQLIQYANSILQQSKDYTDKQAKAAHDSAVRDADAFTTAAIATLVAGVVASILAQQAELATAEAADAAWIAGEGALLLEELGGFGQDLSKILNVAFLASMAAYVGFAVVDPRDTANVTVDIVRPITLPLLDATKGLLGL